MTDESPQLTEFITSETREHQLRTQNVLYMLIEVEKDVIKAKSEFQVQVAELERDFTRKVTEMEKRMRTFTTTALAGFLTILVAIDALTNFIK